MAHADCRPCESPPDREIRTVVGLRPYRPSGFAVRAETFGDTLVVHNYGHGGSGITLSWGTSKLAVDLGAPGHRGPVAVLGAGAVGLSNAVLLQEAGFDVTIYTKAMPPETTSNIAGGQWFPAYLFDRRETHAGIRRSARSPRRITHIAATRSWSARVMACAGCATTRAAIIRSTKADCLPTTVRSAISFRSAATCAPANIRFTGFDYVRQFDTPIVEPSIYLAALLDEFRIAGGKVACRRHSGHRRGRARCRKNSSSIAPDSARAISSAMKN